MAAGVDKMAIHKFTILELAIVYKYPFPFVLLTLHISNSYRLRVSS
jgi:hypothetical protein